MGSDQSITSQENYKQIIEQQKAIIEQQQSEMVKCGKTIAQLQAEAQNLRRMLINAGYIQDDKQMEENDEDFDESDKDEENGSTNNEFPSLPKSTIINEARPIDTKQFKKRVVTVLKNSDLNVHDVGRKEVNKNNSNKDGARSQIRPVAKEYTSQVKNVGEFIHIQKRGIDRETASKKLNEKVNNKLETVKPPPISFYNKSVNELSCLLKSNLNHSNFNFKIINSNLVKVNVNNSYDYGVVVKAFRAQDHKFFTYTPKDKKLNSIFVKGLPPDCKLDDIKNEIDAFNYNLTFAKIVHIGRNFIIQLESGSDVEQFKKIRYLQNCRIYMEDVKKNRIIQCKNCQRFNHTASNCNMEYRCVKCSSKHAPGQCSIPDKENNKQKITITDPVTGEIKIELGIQYTALIAKRKDILQMRAFVKLKLIL